MADITELLALQETDLSLDKALARLAEIEESLGEPDGLAEARSVLEDKDAALKVIKGQQKDMEQAIDDIRAKATEIEKKLYSGAIKDPKELQDYDAELKSLRQLIKVREEEFYGVLEQADTAEKEFAEADEAVSTLDSAWNANKEQMLAEKAELEPEVERLRGIRSEEASEVSRTVLGLYDLLRERRGGRAVAKIERGMCQGCRITLPMSVLQKARSGMTVVQCVSCERILLTT